MMETPRARLLPSTDRTDDGYLRWRVWLPFWLMGVLWGAALVLIRAENHPVIGTVFGVVTAVGLPWAVALRLTRRPVRQGSGPVGSMSP